MSVGRRCLCADYLLPLVELLVVLPALIHRTRTYLYAQQERRRRRDDSIRNLFVSTCERRYEYLHNHSRLDMQRSAHRNLTKERLVADTHWNVEE